MDAACVLHCVASVAHAKLCNQTDLLIEGGTMEHEVTVPNVLQYQESNRAVQYAHSLKRKMHRHRIRQNSNEIQ